MEFWFYTLKRTRKRLKDPIHPKLQELIENYGSLTDYDISIQKYNKHIKEICRIAGIDSNTQVIKVRGRDVTQEIHPKWKLVSNHTARNTFITISLQKGMIPEEVMQVTGHKSRSSFEGYVKTAKQNSFNKLRSVWE